MRVTQDVLECVVFLGNRAEAIGADRMRARLGGTGFFVQVPFERVRGMAATYVVTARHVAQELMAGDGIVRVTAVNGEQRIGTLGPDAQWWFHEDDLVDVAILPWSPSANVRFRSIMRTGILQQDQVVATYAPGDEAAIAGLFARAPGQEANEVVLRAAWIALLPREPIKSSLGWTDLYLVDSRIRGGFSGAPVLVRNLEEPSPGAYRLFGLVHGHWDDTEVVEAADGSRIVVRVNAGLTMVTPAYRILETLDLPEVQEQRRDQEDQTEREAATMD